MSAPFALAWLKGEEAATQALSRIAAGSAGQYEIAGAYAKLDTDAGRLAFFRLIQKHIEQREA